MMHNYVVCKHVFESIKTMKFLKDESKLHCEEEEKKEDDNDEENNKIELIEINQEIVIKDENKEATL